jgi:CubicO group peptidase (beta-lactamase class C family)
VTTQAVPAVHGWVAPGWEPVRQAFEANFARRHEVGAAFSAYHRGEKVADLWGGLADEGTGAPWEEDTLVLTFSTTKGATSVLANLLAQQGRLDFSARVAEYWPEFAAAGKAGITVEQLISHQAGLAWVDRQLDVDDVLAWDPVIRALEAQAPAWPPGTAHGYHATTWGWLVGEVIARVASTSVGAAFRRQVAEPLGLDFFIGLPATEERRVARLVPMAEAISSGRLSSGASPGEAGPGAAGGGDGYLEAVAERAGEYLAPDGPLTKALTAPLGTPRGSEELLSSPKVHGAEMPAFNGIGDARSLARLYAACIGEVVTEGGEKLRLLDERQLDDAVRQRTSGPDRVLLGLDIQWGLGFMVNRGILASAGLGGSRAFGHFGMGGSGAWGDPDAELALAYVMNRMDIGTTGDQRMFTLMAASYQAARRR